MGRAACYTVIHSENEKGMEVSMKKVLVLCLILAMCCCAAGYAEEAEPEATLAATVQQGELGPV